MLRVEGPLVTQLQAEFLLSWHFQGGPLPDDAAGLDRFFPAQPSGTGVQMEILANNPGEKHLPIQAAYRDAIAAAKDRLYVINPYLADRPIIRGIIRAARRGVEVKVIVPADPKSLPASGAVRHWFAEMVEAGVDLREHPHMAHAKVLVSDDTIMAGTANLDGLSLRRNWELMIRARDREVADHVSRELFDRDMEISARATIPTGRRAKAINAVMSTLSPFL